MWAPGDLSKTPSHDACHLLLLDTNSFSRNYTMSHFDQGFEADFQISQMVAGLVKQGKPSDSRLGNFTRSLARTSTSPAPVTWEMYSLVCSWTQACKRLVPLSFPRGRYILLLCAVCVPSWVKIHGCGALCSSLSSCAHGLLVLSSSLPPTLLTVECMSSKSSKFIFSVSRLCTDCQHFGVRVLGWSCSLP